MSSATASAGKARHTETGRVSAWLQRLESPVTTYYVLLSVTAVLVVIGLIMVLSASAIVSYKSSDSSYTIAMRQAQFAVVETWLSAQRALWEGRADRLEKFVTEREEE